MAQLSNEQHVFVVEACLQTVTRKEKKRSKVFATPPESLQILRQHVCDEFDNVKAKSRNDPTSRVCNAKTCLSLQ